MSKKQEYQIGAFANMLGVSIQTLRNWDESGKLKPSRTSKGGTRFYSHSKLDEYGKQHGLANDIILPATLYLTVSHPDELPLLNERVMRAKELINKSAIDYDLTVVTDVFNLSNTDGFTKVLKQIDSRKINTLFVDQALLSEDNLMSTLFHTYTTNRAVTLNKLALSDEKKGSTNHVYSTDIHQAFDQFLKEYQDQITNEVTQRMIKKLIEN